MESIPDHSDDVDADGTGKEKPCKTLGLAGFDAVGATRFELATSTSRTDAGDSRNPAFQGVF